MRVAVDLERCQGNGVCARHAPEVFEVNAGGALRILDDRPGDRHRRAVREAARRCPTRAIRIDP